MFVGSLSSTCAHFSGAFKCETLENWGIWSFENPTPHWGLAITNMPLWQWLKVSKETGNFVPAKRAQVELRPLAQTLAREPPINPALARIVAAWPKLPEVIRKAMLTLAESGE